MTCPTLDNLTLSKKGEEILRDIKQATEWSQYLRIVMVGGTLLNALANDRALPLVFNVTQTDWHALSQAINSMSLFVKQAIRNKAAYMATETTGDEQLFWRAMYEQCY